MYIVRALLLLTSLAVSSSAAVILFTNESAFLAATGPLAFEGFEGTEPGSTGSSRGFTNFILSPSTPDGTFENLEIIRDAAVAAEGQQSAGGAVRNIAFFAFEPMLPNAFGFTIFGFGDEGDPDTFRLVLTSMGETVADLPLVSSTAPFEPFRFFGVVSNTAFDTVIIRQSTPDDFITVDAVYTGNIPEPATAVLVGGALSGIAIWNRWIRKRFGRRS